MQLFNGLAIAAFLQGVAGAFTIWLGGARLYPARVFGWVLLILALLSAKIVLHTTGLWQTRSFHYFPLAIDTTLPACLILYASAVSGKPLGRVPAIFTLLPTIIFLIHALVVYLGAVVQPSTLEADHFADRLLYNPVKEVEDWFAITYAVFCWLYCFRVIRRYRRWLFATQSDGSLDEYTWLKNLLTVSGVLIVGWILLVSMENLIPPGHRHFVHFFVFYTYLAALTWYLSLKGVTLYFGSSKPGGDKLLTGTSKEDNTLQLGNTTRSIVDPTIEDPQIEPVGDPTSEPDKELLAVKDRVVDAMEQRRLYLDPELTLKTVAAATGDPASQVSAAINQLIGKNFRSFVNEYRVAAVKKKLQNPPAHLSLLGVAIESGFNSEASFYRIFRQLEGMSPNEYLQQQK